MRHTNGGSRTYHPALREQCHKRRDRPGSTAQHTSSARRAAPVASRDIGADPESPASISIEKTGLEKRRCDVRKANIANDRVCRKVGGRHITAHADYHSLPKAQGFYLCPKLRDLPLCLRQELFGTVDPALFASTQRLV